MKRLSRRSLLAGVFGLGLARIAAAAEGKRKFTAIYVTDMHCVDCAKKVAGKLYTVPGVVQVKANVPKDVAFVVHQKDKDPQPQALWEAVEAAGFEVVKLQTPTAVFTKKPSR